MKHVSHIVKTTVVAAAIMAIGSSAFAALIDEDFEGVNSFALENFGGGAINTYSMETVAPLSGLQSLKLDITNSGDAGNWWALQVRQGVTFSAGDVIEVSFQVSSTADISFLSRLEGDNTLVPDGSVNELITVLAGETKTVTHQYAAMLGNGGGTYMFALGDSTAGAAVVLIDDVTVQVVPEPATLGLLGLAAAGLLAARRFRM